MLIAQSHTYHADSLKSMVQEIGNGIEVVAIAHSLKAIEEYINSRQQIDLILMDVCLADGIAFELFAKTGSSIPVIYATSHSQFALEAFHFNTIHYLVNPITRNGLQKALNKYYHFKNIFSEEKKTGDAERMFFKAGKNMVSVSLAEIAYFHSRRGLTMAVDVQNRKYVIGKNLNELAASLKDNRFHRLNRQYLTSFQAIKKYSRMGKGRLEVLLHPAGAYEKVIVSSKQHYSFMQWINENSRMPASMNGHG